MRKNKYYHFEKKGGTFEITIPARTQKQAIKLFKSIFTLYKDINIKKLYKINRNN